MFIQKGMKVRAVHNDGSTYIGNVKKIIIDTYNSECKTPCGLIIISENKKPEVTSLVVEQLKTIEIL